jgi:hypothetical protein
MDSEVDKATEGAPAKVQREGTPRSLGELPPKPPARKLSALQSPPAQSKKTSSSSKSSSSRSSKTPTSPSVKSPPGNKTRDTVSALRKTKRKTGTKKGITFKKTVAVLTVPNLDTYTTQEKEQTWYAADDYGQMEDECDMTAELLDRRKPLWPGQCSRGLEGWTMEGEQRKEGHVQLALDVVWQAQLEQWKASSDVNECWEFIRSRYLAVTIPCQGLANKRAIADEQEVQSYLAGVRSVEKNRLRLMGIHYRDTRSRRSHTDGADDQGSTPAGNKKHPGRSLSEIGGTSIKSPPGRHHSSNTIKGSPKGLLKVHSEEDELSQTSTNRKIRHQPPREGAANDDDVSTVASSVRSRKISYQAKSKSKIPTSPVRSLCSAHDEDEDSVSRRMRSHMSVSSEDSTRRRMLRTTNIKPPLL